MTDRQKRVMIKLFAVSAFLNHRDFRDSSAASVLRLRDETERIFSQPLTADSRASLKTICMQVGLLCWGGGWPRSRLGGGVKEEAGGSLTFEDVRLTRLPRVGALWHFTIK